MKGRLLFILTLWLAIGIALLSALAPLGPPSSRLTGSAFNPATTAVVLKARAQAVPVPVRVTEPDGDGRTPLATPALILLPPFTVLLPVLALVAAVSRFFLSVPVFRPSSCLSPIQARAPPFLS